MPFEGAFAFATAKDGADPKGQKRPANELWFIRAWVSEGRKVFIRQRGRGSRKGRALVNRADLAWWFCLRLAAGFKPCLGKKGCVDKEGCADGDKRRDERIEGVFLVGSEGGLRGVVEGVLRDWWKGWMGKTLAFAKTGLT